MQRNQAGLYIHIPFCQSKCDYCSFYSIKSVNLIPEYIAALEKEIQFYSKLYKSFDTVYLGGGTPSLLSIQQIETIFHAINKSYQTSPDKEITMELNPGDVSLDYFQALRSLGINRINIGIQSFDDAILKFLGRRHNQIQAEASITDARRTGFTNIGIDLIYGIPYQNIESWRQTLQKAISFSPEHLSCYQLSLEPKTSLYKIYQANGIKLPANEEQAEYYFTTAETLEEAGYIHYEVSNFAHNDYFKSRHNQKYWQHEPYLGLGPAAHSFIGNKRWWNKKAVKTYLNDIAQGKAPVDNTETLSGEQLQLETLFLGLRTRAGIDLELFKNRFGTDLRKDKKRMIDELIKDELVELKDGFLYPTRSGMAVADSLALI